MATTIGVLVEGFSETFSAPPLLRRIAESRGRFDLEVAKPFRVKRNLITKEGELERSIKTLLKKRQGLDAVLVILDADDDCPGNLGPELVSRGTPLCGERPLCVVLAKREFESWFLGSIESLRGHCGIGMHASAPDNPENIRGAKERVSANMIGRRYVEVDDQPALVSVMDLESVQNNCPSFAKLVRDVVRCLG